MRPKIMSQPEDSQSDLTAQRDGPLAGQCIEDRESEPTT